MGLENEVNRQIDQRINDIKSGYGYTNSREIYILKRELEWVKRLMAELIKDEEIKQAPATADAKGGEK